MYKFCTDVDQKYTCMASLFTSGSGLGCLLRVTEGFRKLRIFAGMHHNDTNNPTNNNTLRFR